MRFKLICPAVVVVVVTLGFASDEGSSVTGKTYVSAEGDTIKFGANGKARETNGARGEKYSYQSGMFNGTGYFTSECSYTQTGNKVELLCDSTVPSKLTYTVNKDGSLSGPPKGMYNHPAFAHMIRRGL